MNLFGTFISGVIILWVVYNLYDYFRAESKENRKAAKKLELAIRNQLSKEKTKCYACGKSFTKDKMGLYNIVISESYSGCSTHTSLLGGTTRIHSKKVRYYEGYICKTCQRNWDISLIVGIIGCLIGGAISVALYSLITKLGVDEGNGVVICGCFFIVIATGRLSWKLYRKATKCHIKVIN